MTTNATTRTLGALTRRPTLARWAVLLLALLVLPATARAQEVDDEANVPYGGYAFDPSGLEQSLGGPPTSCISSIDFDNLAVGTVFKSTRVYADKPADNADLQHYAGVEIFAVAGTPSGSSLPRRAMIFDSANPTGGDTDLQTPGTGPGNNTARGKILIISEDNDASDPDDNASGGFLVFIFNQPVEIGTLGLLDIEMSEGGFGARIRTYDADFNLFGSTITVMGMGNNSWENVNVGRTGVRALTVQFGGSGAVTDLQVSCGIDLQCGSSADVDPVPVDNATPQQGDILTFTPTFSNQGPTTASGVVVTATYDAAKFACPGGDCMATINGSSAGTNDATAGTVTFAIGSLASGASANLSFKLQVDANASGSGNVSVYVSAADQFDADSSPIVFPPQEDDACVSIFDELPVELTLFEAQLDGRDVVLAWETASETNNAGFEVQHRAPTSEHFETTTFVSGAGTTIEAQRYSHRLSDLAPGTHRFRLRQLDYDGSFEYSAELEVSVELPTSYVVSPVYPNPFNPEARLSFGVKRAQQVTVTLYDMLGREVRVLYAGTVPADVTRSLVIDGTGLQSGTYLLRVQGETFVDTQTLTLIK